MEQREALFTGRRRGEVPACCQMQEETLEDALSGIGEGENLARVWRKLDGEWMWREVNQGEARWAKGVKSFVFISNLVADKGEVGGSSPPWPTTPKPSDCLDSVPLA